MKNSQLIISFSAVVFGLVVLGISLVVARPALSFDQELAVSHRQFYIDKEILPDHLAYPLLMAVDRARLEVASPGKRLELQLEYAWRRLETSRQLLIRNKPQLALNTLARSQQYLIQTAEEIDHLQLEPAYKMQLTEGIAEYLLALEELGPEFENPQQRDAFNKLVNGCQILNN